MFLESKIEGELLEKFLLLDYSLRLVFVADSDLFCLNRQENATRVQLEAPVLAGAPCHLLPAPFLATGRVVPPAPHPVLAACQELRLLSHRPVSPNRDLVPSPQLMRVHSRVQKRLLCRPRFYFQPSLCNGKLCKLPQVLSEIGRSKDLLCLSEVDLFLLIKEIYIHIWEKSINNLSAAILWWCPLSVLCACAYLSVAVLSCLFRIRS